MSLSEIDQAFASLIDKSAEMLNIAHPRTDFSELIPVKPEPRVEIDFNLITTITGNQKQRYHQEYQALYSELKRFEPRALTFSALEPGQGVTFTATNIARLWADEDKDKKILLLEFYNGFSGSEYENYKDEKAQAINEPQSLEDAIGFIESDNLYILSIRSAAAKTDIGEFWQRLKSSFDLIIIDAAPKGFNILTDQAISLSTGVILITAQKPDPVHIKTFERETKELSGRFLGVILNAME